MLISLTAAMARAVLSEEIYSGGGDIPLGRRANGRPISSADQGPTSRRTFQGRRAVEQIRQVGRTRHHGRHVRQERCAHQGRAREVAAGEEELHRITHSSLSVRAEWRRTGNN